MGLTFGLELTRQYNQPGRQTIIDGNEAELVDNEKDIGWVIFKPSLTIKTPAVWKSLEDNCSLWAQIEPGLSLACPFRNSLTYEIKNFSGGIGQTVDYRKFPNQGLQWFIGIPGLRSAFPLTVLYSEEDITFQILTIILDEEILY